MQTPINTTTGKEYTGGNVAELLAAGFTSNEWATYKQWQGEGMQVQRGQKGTRITKMVKIICKKEHKEKLVPRYYTVFNAEQVAPAEQQAAAAK
ncbi:MAG: ArdC-like ssDNA-binding domain-containing protein [Alphaproteobacteria bacterium]